ncbi:MAG: hypothetical protein KC493_12190 [Bacteriovoracaceae bacterium]|nr:hypothetical protein [Bacteriovoracaceae bacterium]
MKIRKIVLSLYLSNQDVVRVKISPFAIITVMILGIGITGYLNHKPAESVVVSETVPAAKKEFVAVQPTKPNLAVERVNTVDQNRFEIKNFSIEKKENKENIKFYLTKKDNTPGPRRGIIKVKSLTNIADLGKVEESFEFNFGRYTEVPIKEEFKKDLSNFLVEVIENNITVLKQEVVMKDGLFKIKRN